MMIPSQGLIVCKTCGNEDEPHKVQKLHCKSCGNAKAAAWVRAYRIRLKANPKPRMCKECGKEFLPTHGVTSLCKTCNYEYHKNYSERRKKKCAEYARNYRKRLGDAYREKSQRRYHQRIAEMSSEEEAQFRKNEAEKTRRLVTALKDAAYSAYGGYKCSCCGEIEPMFLTLDHINNDGNKQREKHGKTPERLYRWLKKNSYPDGFQVLCMNCNLGKHRNGGVCPHQTRCNDYPVTE